MQTQKKTLLFYFILFFSKFACIKKINNKGYTDVFRALLLDVHGSPDSAARGFLASLRRPSTQNVEVS